MEFDYLIVGAGLSGLILAERICSTGKTVLMVDRKPHIGGILFDKMSSNKILCPQYGLNYFTLHDEAVKKYLSQFSEWSSVTETKAIYSDGRLWRLPFDKSTLEMISGFKCDNDDFNGYIEQHRVQISTPTNAEEYALDKFGSDIYERFLKGYLQKKYKRNPTELDFKILEDLEPAINFVPKLGYTRMFDNMIERCGDKLATLFKTDYFEVRETIKHNHLIYTGTLDNFFHYGHGILPCTSFTFKEENYDVHFYQSNVQINYPNVEDYSAIIEPKHIFGGTKKKTTILKQFTEKYNGVNDPFCPIHNSVSLKDFANYKYLSENTVSNTSFVGRVTDFQIKTNDQVAKQAITFSICQ